MFPFVAVLCIKFQQRGSELEGGFELVFEGLHVEVDGAVEPFLVLFGGEGADEPEAALFVGGRCARSGCGV